MEEVVTTTNLTVEQAAAAGGMIGAMFSVSIFIALACYILTIIASWKIFKKAGEKGWKALIPIYNTYIMFKIVDMQNWFWGLLAVSFFGCLILSLSGYDMYAVTEEQIMARVNAMSNPTVFITMFVMFVVSIWATILYAIRTAKVFGKRGGFAVGLIFLTLIFWLILAFDKSKYNKKNLKK